MGDSTIPPQPFDRETVASFARWVKSAYRLTETVPDAASDPRRSGDARSDHAADPPLHDVDSLRRRLLELSAASGEAVVEAVPGCDPQRVREISATILSGYQVRDGHVELAGCALEPRPFLRLTFPNSDPERLVHLWFGDDGRRVDAALAERLHFDQLEPIPCKLRGSDVAMIERWIDAAWQTLQSEAREQPPWQREMLVGATIAWCRRASGKVAIVFEEGPTAQVSFDGWAADFRAGHVRPRPYRCPRSGLESFQVVALPDGTVTVPEATAHCDHSGREVLADQLSRCELTGQRVLPEFLISCAVTGRRVLADAAVRCQWCQRAVVPGELARDLCRDCRWRQPIPVDHPLLQKVLRQHTQFARFGGWTGWTDDSIGVFVGKRRLREVVLVCDGEAELIRVGRRMRMGGAWQMPSPKGEPF